MDQDQNLVDSPTLHAHKQQFAWQILVPFLLMTGLIIAGAVLVVTGGTSQTGVWADVSIIWMLIPVLVLGILLTIVLAALIYGFARLTRVTPHFTAKAQGIFSLVAAWSKKIADGTTKPVLWTQQAGAVIKSLFRKS